MLDYAYGITQCLLAVAVIGAVYRIYRGPSVLDRVISVDVILIIVASMLIADMAYYNHQDYIVFVLITAVVGFMGAVAIVRYVVVRRPDTAGSSVPDTLEGEPDLSPTEPAEEDESTSWFTALTKSGFTPSKPAKGADRQ